MKIFNIRFKLINFYHLCYICGHHYELLCDLECIGIEDEMLKLKKALSTYKNFEKSFYEVYLKSFLNYTLIMILLFAHNIAKLNISLNAFYGIIFQISQEYKW